MFFPTLSLLSVVAAVLADVPVLLESRSLYPAIPFGSPSYNLEIPYPTVRAGFFPAARPHSRVFSDASGGAYVVISDHGGYPALEYPYVNNYIPGSSAIPARQNSFRSYPGGQLESFPQARFRGNVPPGEFQSPVGPSPSGTHPGSQSENRAFGPATFGPQRNNLPFGNSPTGNYGPDGRNEPSRQGSGNFPSTREFPGGPAPTDRQGPAAFPRGPEGGSHPFGPSSARAGPPGPAPGFRSGPGGFQSPQGPASRSGNFGSGSGDYGPPFGSQGSPRSHLPPGAQSREHHLQAERRTFGPDHQRTFRVNVQQGPEYQYDYMVHNDGQSPVRSLHPGPRSSLPPSQPGSGLAAAN